MRKKTCITYQFCEEVFDSGSWNIFPIVKAYLTNALDCYCTYHRTTVLEQLLRVKSNKNYSVSIAVNVY